MSSRFKPLPRDSSARGNDGAATTYPESANIAQNRAYPGGPRRYPWAKTTNGKTPGRFGRHTVVGRLRVDATVRPLLTTGREVSTNSRTCEFEPDAIVVELAGTTVVEVSRSGSLADDAVASASLAVDDAEPPQLTQRARSSAEVATTPPRNERRRRKFRNPRQ